jgi:hypothetical protein
MFGLPSRLLGVALLIALVAVIGGLMRVLLWLLEFNVCLYSFLGAGALLALALAVGDITTRARGWRVGIGRDSILSYEERVRGTWSEITFDTETTEAGLVVFLIDKVWDEHPDWARARRAEITERIRQRFPNARIEG